MQMFFIFHNVAPSFFSPLIHASINNRHRPSSFRAVSHCRASFHATTVIWVPRQPLVYPSPCSFIRTPTNHPINHDTPPSMRQLIAFSLDTTISPTRAFAQQIEPPWNLHGSARHKPRAPIGWKIKVKPELHYQPRLLKCNKTRCEHKPPL